MSTFETSSTLQQEFEINYGPEVEEEIVKLQTEIDNHPVIQKHFPERWLAIQLLEEDEDLQIKLQTMEGGMALLNQAGECVVRLAKIYGEDVDIIIADRRYGWINGLVKSVVRRTAPNRFTLSDQIDTVVTNRVLGIPIFIVAMYVVFKLTTDVSAPYLDWVAGSINGPITSWVVAILGALGLGDTWVESLFVDGIIAGVGGVLVFVPVLMSLYLGLAVLEDSGYMARAAFVMDRLMQTIGLHGKSFLPMLVGFGCTVPAIYATRTLENEQDRRIRCSKERKGPLSSWNCRPIEYPLCAASGFTCGSVQVLSCARHGRSSW
jgi:ferrous iron transport protein B